MAGRTPRLKIIIETLTGTLFELLVSQQDTVLSIKWRIYRIEGMNFQSFTLIYQSISLIKYNYIL